MSIDDGKIRELQQHTRDVIAAMETLQKTCFLALSGDAVARVVCEAAYARVAEVQKS